MSTDLVVAKLDRASLFLAQANTIEKAKLAIAIGEATRIYGLRMKAGREAMNQVAIYQLRAERNLGKILEKVEMSKGGRPRKTSSKTEQVSRVKTLEEEGIDRKVSSRAQVLAAIPDENFEVLATPPEDGELNQRKVVRDLVEKAKLEKRKEARIEASKRIQDVDSRILVGDFRERASEIPDGSLSLIFTDPPYDRKSEELFPGLADFASKKLAEGGSMIFYVGHLQLPAVFLAFDGKLRHWWTCACIHSGEKALMREYGIRVGWKPMLWFVKGTRDDKSNIVFDTVTGDREKEFHDWQQHESDAVYYIETLCPQDGIVCDPFLGGGTTAVAASHLGRKWIACEIDEEVAKTASARLESK